jgi:FkbM family methyltransferase
MKVSISGLELFWPEAAELEPLWIVLSETLVPEHPHYYNSGLATIRPNDTVLDIGACEGAFTASAARIAQSVIAVEPSRIMRRAISESAKSMNLRNVQSVEVLIGDTSRSVSFIEDVANPLNGRIAESGNGSYDVDCLTLDELSETYIPDGVTYIKCDAEGYDVKIITSAAQMLSRCKPKLAIATYHAPGDFEVLQEFLLGLGYEVEAQGLYYDAVVHDCYPTLLKARHPDARRPTQ